MSYSELDAQYARERHADYVNAARIRRLIREAQATSQISSTPPAKPARHESLFARIYAALRPTRVART